MLTSKGERRSAVGIFFGIAILLSAVSGLRAGDFGDAQDLRRLRKPKKFDQTDLVGTCTWQSVSVTTDRSGLSAEPATMIGRATFDGKGNVQVTHARTNFDGVPVRGSLRGTYLVNKDGDGTMTFNFGSAGGKVNQLIYDFQLSESGRVMRFQREQDETPIPIGNTDKAITSRRVSLGVCRMGE